MFIKDLNLYINEKNIVTVMPYISDCGDYGLEINGVKCKLGADFNLVVGAIRNNDEYYRLYTATFGKMKALQTQIIKKIEKE